MLWSDLRPGDLVVDLLLTGRYWLVLDRTEHRATWLSIYQGHMQIINGGVNAFYKIEEQFEVIVGHRGKR
jgi:hypothetical protein